MSNIAIIPARGGSKGLPDKNIKEFCGRPLLAWSILQAKKSKYIDSVWVTSDSDKILDISVEYGANPIKRPLEISGDTASSESAWLHAIEFVKGTGIDIDLILGMQATSPIREPSDIDNAFSEFDKFSYTSLFTSAQLEDYFIWKKDQESMIGVNHDFTNRKRRQEITEKFLENGSFYIFKEELIFETNNRLGGKVGTYVMDDYKRFQIDSESDFKLCEVIMKGYELDKI